MYYYVYIMTNRSQTLYVGVTNDIARRVWEHRNGNSDFTSRYKIDTLVYYERFGDVRSAIAREKQIKAYRRIKKLALIVAANPSRRDLSANYAL